MQFRLICGRYNNYGQPFALAVHFGSPAKGKLWCKNLIKCFYRIPRVLHTKLLSFYEYFIQNFSNVSLFSYTRRAYYMNNIRDTQIRKVLQVSAICPWKQSVCKPINFTKTHTEDEIMFITFEKFFDVMNMNRKFVILCTLRGRSPILIFKTSNINFSSKSDKCSVAKKCMELKCP
jgi:hypothetical protein